MTICKNCGAPTDGRSWCGEVCFMEDDYGGDYDGLYDGDECDGECDGKDPDVYHKIQKGE